MSKFKSAVLFYNSSAGHSKKGRQLECIINYFESNGISLRIIKIPVPNQDIQETINSVNCDNADLIIAAGGDGTLSLISNKIIGTEIPIGILPLGTGNLFAQELKIPLNLEKALALITAENPKIKKIDAIKLIDRYCLLNISIGVSPKVMKKTKSREKQRYGIFAYLANLIQQFFNLKLHRFFVDYDGQNINFHASEVLITNGKSAGIESLKLSDKIALNDGILDLFIIRATDISDIFRIILSFFSKKYKRNGLMKYIQFSDYCRIETQTPIPIQADGDTIGVTPIDIRISPKSVNIIVSENLSS